MQVSSIINGVIFSAVTAGGVAVGRVYQGLQEFQGNFTMGNTPTIIGAAAGATFGSLIAGLLWAQEYNPIPGVYRDLTTRTYRVVRRYESTSENFLVVRVARRADNKQAVLKMARPDSTDNDLEALKEMLANEYRTLSIMDSPHVVRPIGFVKGYKYFVLVLEYVEGPTLEERLKDRNALDFFQTLEFALASARALKEMHSKGYRFGHESDYGINVILHPERRVVLIDPSAGGEKSLGPQDEMDLWAEMVDRVFGGKTADQCTGLELRLRAILDRASGRAYLPRHASYNELADELEKLARDASASK